MIGAIQNLITSPAIYNATQSTVTQVTTETCLKAIGRPSFILMDKQIDPQTKKFSATKEFLYQATCLAIYLAAITPLAKKYAYKIAQNSYKDEAVFKAFGNVKEFMNFHQLKTEAEKIAKLDELSKKMGVTFTREKVSDAEKAIKKEISQDGENLARGVIEAGSIFGSVAGLAILAPIVSHPIIHPVMEALGFDAPQKPEQKPLEEKK